MAKLFRLACSIDSYLSSIDKSIRPIKPIWLQNENKENATRNQAHSFNYWTKIYFATPPWITLEQINEMREIYKSASKGNHIDHIVPLSSKLVCGLHVPWNLQVLTEKENLIKSNNYWPNHPFENLDLFGE